MNYGSRIIGTGVAHPERIMPNAEFETFLNTSDEWIRTRTGIETRHICDPKKGENNLSLSIASAKKAVEDAKIDPAEIEMIVVGTVTANSVMPTTGNAIQAALGSPRAFSFDLQAACAGFLYGFSIADQFIRTGAVKTALVVGTETLSTLTDWTDRSTCVLFGDASGSMVLQRTEDPERRVIGTKLYSDGNFGDILCIPHGGSGVPPYTAEYSSKQHKIKMKGAELFKHAVRNMVDASVDLMKTHGVTPDDVDLFLFHQANSRIIDYCAKTLNVEAGRMWNNVAKYGNTSSATLPLCLDEARKAGVAKEGNLILMTTFGGGLTWASALARL